MYVSLFKKKQEFSLNIVEWEMLTYTKIGQMTTVPS
jgi:hypothetical protein